MNLSQSQIDLLTAIQAKIRRGDITELAKNTGFTREYVGMVLSPTNSDYYNEVIVGAAARMIELREQNTNKLLKKLTSDNAAA